MTSLAIPDAKVVIVLGAGATLADGLRRPASKRPPLDRGFFANCAKSSPADLRPIERYMTRHYGADVTTDSRDSLEAVMAVLYTDSFGGDTEDEAFKTLRALINLFVKRLANTTNDIGITRRCLLYRLIVWFINAGVRPENLTIISFNQDIQAEKALDDIGKRTSRSPIWSFPDCYHLPSSVTVTSPGDARAPRFETEQADQPRTTLLKLHGSLNWYSRHNTTNPSKGQLFEPKRKINITSRKVIDTSMRINVRPGERTKFTLPVVVPPVVHKAGILPADLFPVWELARQRLTDADRVIIFAYSCPATDWERKSNKSSPDREPKGQGDLRNRPRPERPPALRPVG